MTCPVLKSPPSVCPRENHADAQAVADLVSPLHASPSVRYPHCVHWSSKHDQVAYPEARKVSLPSIASKKRKVSAGRE